MAADVQVEIWSDVVCPWCYIGKRRFERAVDELRGEIDVDVVYRAFQLDPGAPVGSPTPVADVYARKFGGPERARAIIDHVTGIAAAEGLEFRLDRAVRANTLLAHRLLWWTEQRSHDAQTELKERLLHAYFVDGRDVGDVDVLAGCAVEAGLDGGEAARFLLTDDGTDEVMASIAQAYERGITAVPTYVVGGAWSIPGAQDSETYVQVLRRMAGSPAGATRAVRDV